LPAEREEKRGVVGETGFVCGTDPGGGGGGGKAVSTCEDRSKMAAVALPSSSLSFSPDNTTNIALGLQLMACLGVLWLGVFLGEGIWEGERKGGGALVNVCVCEGWTRDTVRDVTSTMGNYFRWKDLTPLRRYFFEVQTFMIIFYFYLCFALATLLLRSPLTVHLFGAKDESMMRYAFDVFVLVLRKREEKKTAKISQRKLYCRSCSHVLAVGIYRCIQVKTLVQ